MIHFNHDDTVAGDLVEIRWLDAAFALDEPPEPCSMTTVGWITDTNQEWVTIAQEKDEAGCLHRAYTTIPRTLITEVLRLQQVRD